MNLKIDSLSFGFFALLETVLRLGLGATLLVAAITKIADMKFFEGIIRDALDFSNSMSSFVAALLVSVELFSALTLLLKLHRPYSAYLASLLFTFFSGYNLLGLNSSPKGCGCFGSKISEKLSLEQHRDLTLLLLFASLGLVILARYNQRPTDKTYENKN